jgi:HK97 family phage major capsid protein
MNLLASRAAPADPSAAAGGEIRRKQQGADAPAGAGPTTFVLSSEAVDLEGDVVVQSGLVPVSDRVPAQVDHSGQMRDLIGSWQNIRRSQGRTLADLSLLERGISQSADLVRALLDAGIRMAASIGFVPTKTSYIRDEKNERITGFRFEASRLVEASVVVVPANPEALNLAKSLLRTPAERAALEQLLAGARPGLPGASTRPAVPRAAAGHRTMTTLAERIQAAEAAVTATKDALDAAQIRLGGDADDAVQAEVAELLERVARESRSLQLLKDTETALAARASPAGTESPDRMLTRAAATGATTLLKRRPKASADLLIRSAVVALEAHVKHASVEQILASRYADDDGGIATVARMTVKAAQAPAMTNVPTWAQELVRQTYADFIDLLKPVSVVPQLPMTMLSFDGFGVINIPARTTRTPNLAAAFRAEGAPIRVGAASLSLKKMTPKSLGVIGTFTNELFQRSTPDIEQLIRDFILEDTAVMLDGYFFSATAAIAGVSPGGILAGLPAGVIHASTGTTLDEILHDLQAMVSGMAAANLLKKPVWVMNPVNASALAFMRTATGQAAFPDITISGGMLAGLPVITSTNIAADKVWLVDGAGLYFAGDVPTFLGTEEATLHEEDTTPLPIGSAGTPAVVAAPVRSLYQTNSAALRVVWEVDWQMVYDGAVQVLTGVTWSA